MNPIKTVKLFAFKIKRANYKRAWDRAKEAGRLAGKPALLVLLDMLWCSARYGAAFTDYFMFRFYGRPGRERREFITMNKNNKLIAFMNDPSKRHLLDKKTDLVEHFRAYMHREILVLGKTPRGEVVGFIERHPVLFAKKNYMFSAKGVERFDCKDYANAEELYDHIVSAGFDLIEEPIVQHPDMARLYPGAVNTLRVVTVLIDDVCDIVFAALKTGNQGTVDNMNAGGLSAAVQVDTGVVYTDGVIKNGGTYEAHPVTGIVYKGYQIPMWDQVKELVGRAAREVPTIRLVGWDVAITSEGPILVEGNYLPGYDLLQLPDMTGRMWILRKYMKRA